MPSLPRLPRLPLVLVLVAGALPAAFSQCSATLNILSPSAGQTITVDAHQSGLWTQWWELSILAGNTCTGAHTLHGQLLVNGKMHNLEPNTPAWTLSVGAITSVVTWPGVSYATLTPQTATVVPPPPPRYQETEFKSLWTSTAAPRRAKRASNYDIVIGYVIITTPDGTSSTASTSQNTGAGMTTDITETATSVQFSNPSTENSPTIIISSSQPSIVAATSASVPLPTQSSRSDLSSGAVGGIVGGILCALLISLAIVAYYRYKKKPKAMVDGEKRVTDPGDNPLGGRLRRENEPLDSGRLREDVNGKVENAFAVPENEASEGDGRERLLSDGGVLANDH